MQLGQLRQRFIRRGGAKIRSVGGELGIGLSPGLLGVSENVVGAQINAVAGAQHEIEGLCAGGIVVSRVVGELRVQVAVKGGKGGGGPIRGVA